MEGHSLLQNRLNLDPEWFRALAIRGLEARRTELRGLAATSLDGEHTIIDVICLPNVSTRKGETYSNTVGREIARCDRAIAEIEAQRE